MIPKAKRARGWPRERQEQSEVPRCPSGRGEKGVGVQRPGGVAQRPGWGMTVTRKTAVAQDSEVGRRQGV